MTNDSPDSFGAAFVVLVLIIIAHPVIINGFWAFLVFIAPVAVVLLIDAIRESTMTKDPRWDGRVLHNFDPNDKDT